MSDPNSSKPSGHFWNRLVRFGREILNRSSQLLDRVIYNKTYSMIATGVVALVFCLSVNFQDLRFRFIQSNTTTFNMAAVPVEIIADTDVYEVSGVPNTADLSASGDPTDIQLLRTQNTVAVSCNLRNLTEGVNTVALQATGIPSGVDVTITPSTVQATLSKKLTKTYFITPDIIVGPGQESADFEVSDLSKKSVSIKATKEKLNSIRSVKAIIDCQGHATDFTLNCPLVAYDSNGRQVNVQINPDTITATVKIVKDVAPAQEESGQEPAEAGKE